MTRHKPYVDGKVANNHYGGFMRGFSLKTFLKCKNVTTVYVCLDNYIFIKPDIAHPTFIYKSQYFILNYDINQNEL